MSATNGDGGGKVVRRIKREIHIPPKKPHMWSQNSTYKLVDEGDGNVHVFAPCGADYGYITKKDLAEALKFLSMEYVVAEAPKTPATA